MHFHRESNVDKIYAKKNIIAHQTKAGSCEHQLCNCMKIIVEQFTQFVNIVAQ